MKFLKFQQYFVSNCNFFENLEWNKLGKTKRKHKTLQALKIKMSKKSQFISYKIKLYIVSKTQIYKVYQGWNIRKLTTNIKTINNEKFPNKFFFLNFHLKYNNHILFSMTLNPKCLTMLPVSIAGVRFFSCVWLFDLLVNDGCWHVVVLCDLNL
jgi:hypothetical protein